MGVPQEWKEAVLGQWKDADLGIVTEPDPPRAPFQPEATRASITRRWVALTALSELAEGFRCRTVDVVTHPARYS